MATVNGQLDVVTAGDIAALRPVLGLRLTSGRLDGLGDNDLVVHENPTKSNHRKVGEIVRIKQTKGGQRPYRLAGIYRSTLTGGVLLYECERSAVAAFSRHQMGGCSQTCGDARDYETDLPALLYRLL